MKLTKKWYNAPHSSRGDAEAHENMLQLYRPFNISITNEEIEFFGFFGKKHGGMIHIVFDRFSGEFKKVYGKCKNGGSVTMQTEACLRACDGVAKFIYNMMANGYIE